MPRTCTRRPTTRTRTCCSRRCRRSTARTRFRRPSAPIRASRPRDPPSACPFADRCPWKVGPVCDEVSPRGRARATGTCCAATSRSKSSPAAPLCPACGSGSLGEGPRHEDRRARPRARRRARRADRGAAPGRVRLLPLRGERGRGRPRDVEIAVYGLLRRPALVPGVSDRCRRCAGSTRPAPASRASRAGSSRRAA